MKVRVPFTIFPAFAKASDGQAFFIFHSTFHNQPS